MAGGPVGGETVTSGRDAILEHLANDARERGRAERLLPAV